MSQIYVSGPWSFASGVQQVVKSIKAKSKGDKVVYSEKGTADTFYQIINNQFGTIVAPNDTPGFVLSHQDTVLGSDCIYLKGEWIADPLDFLNVEQPKSYFY